MKHLPAFARMPIESDILTRVVAALQSRLVFCGRSWWYRRSDCWEPEFFGSAGIEATIRVQIQEAAAANWDNENYLAVAESLQGITNLPQFIKRLQRPLSTEVLAHQAPVTPTPEP